MGAVLSTLAALRRRPGHSIPLSVAVAVLVWYFAFNRRISLARAAWTRAFGLRPYENLVRVQAAARIPMRDGIDLVATLLLPRLREGQRCKHVILLRTPYNRKFVLLGAQRFAERGYAVVAQDTRGRFESDGTFTMLKDEKLDGVDTMRWIKKQPWFDTKHGSVAMWGISYLGFVQWALLDGVMEAHKAAGGTDPTLPRLAALVPIMTSSNFYPVCYPDGAVAMDLLLRWLHLTHYIGGPGFTGQRLRALTWWQKLYLAFLYDRRQEHDHSRAKREWTFTQMQKTMLTVDEPLVPIETDETSEFWQQRIHTKAVKHAPAVHCVAGWYDLMLRETVRDYERVRDARREGDGTPTMLTIGPWFHFESIEFGPFSNLISEGVDLFDTVMRGKRGLLRDKPVRLFVMDGGPSKGEWRDFEQWPPLSVRRRLYLHGGGALKPSVPKITSTVPSTYRFDPNDPTPMLAGAVFHQSHKRAGAVDNTDHEARHDVLVFSTEPLAGDVQVIGQVSAQLYVRLTGAASADFVARLCDVHPNGKSINLCDGLCRVANAAASPATDGMRARQPSFDGDNGADVGAHNFDSSFVQVDAASPTPGAGAGAGAGAGGGGGASAEGVSTVRVVKVDMWLTANVFRRGHRIRLQVSSGQHPRWARNLGTATGGPDESRVTQDTAAVSVELFHDASSPSSVQLPVVGSGLASHGSQAQLLPRSRSQALLAVLGKAHSRSVQNFSQM